MLYVWFSSDTGTAFEFLDGMTEELWGIADTDEAI